MKFYISLFFVLSSFASFAGPKIIISGNTKTHNNVIHTEIKELLTTEVSDETLKEIERRLWNLRLFSKVKVKLADDNKIKINVEERWTTIPIAKVSSGGGSTYYALGAYDINSFGSNTELGAQYESLNNRPAGVAWLRKPQFLKDRNLNIGFDIWSINRVRDFYESKSSDEIGAFTLERKRFNSFIERKWNNDSILAGFQFDYQEDKISDFGLSDEQKELNEKNNILTDSNNTSRFHSAYLKLGRLNYKNYLVEGKQLTLKSTLAVISSEEQEILSAGELHFLFFKLFKDNHNFAWQLKLLSNNYKEVQSLNYLGGLTEVRGYMDGQYYNNTVWYNNFEHRFDLYENKFGIIQGNIFSDQAKEGEDLDELSSRKEEILLSTGFGIRFISPKIYRFVARLDYAQTHTRFINQNISFGIQQFF